MPGRDCAEPDAVPEPPCRSFQTCGHSNIDPHVIAGREPYLTWQLTQFVVVQIHVCTENGSKLRAYIYIYIYIHIHTYIHMYVFPHVCMVKSR